MDVLEIRNRATDRFDGDGDPVWEQKSVVHKNTDAKTVCRNYYPNYRIVPHNEVDGERNGVVPKSFNPNVYEVAHYDVIPQKEKIYDPHAPASEVDSQLVELP